MPAIPGLQHTENNGEVLLFWELAPSREGIASFNLYWSYDEDQTSVVAGGVRTFPTQNLLAIGIPNSPSYGKGKACYTFRRSSIGVPLSSSFFVSMSAVLVSGEETALGLPRYMAYRSTQPVEVGTVNSPLTKSLRMQRSIGPVPERVLFPHDIKQLEVFNYSKDTVLFVDVTGRDASVAESMPIMPYGYYVIGRNLSREAGVSLVAGSASGSDVRMVVHF